MREEIFFRRETCPEIGLAQIHSTEPTGVWIGFNDENGSLKFGKSYYGAALRVKITQSELEEESNGIFITDISSCKNEEIHSQTDTILTQIDHEGSIFVLSLGGARPSSVKPDRLSSIINSLRYKPQIVFSNLEEFKYTAQTEDIEKAIANLFPNARLVVVTCGEQGSLIRFENQLIEIPAFLVANVKDEVGAGDTYMGTMLGQLFNYPYNEWTNALVRHCSSVAAFVSSQIVTTSYVRLGQAQTQAVLDYSFIPNQI